MKALALFGFGFSYYYPVISRSYCLIPLFAFMMACFYPARREKPLRYGLAIALMVQTHVIMLGMAATASLVWLAEALAGYRRDRRRRPRTVNDILIREQAQLPVRPHQAVVPGKPHAPLGKAVAADPASLMGILPVFIPVALIHHNGVRLKVHPLRQGFHILIHRGDQKLQSHVRSPFFP